MRIYRNFKDFVKVKANNLYYIIYDLRHVYNALRQKAPKDILAKILENTEEIKRKAIEPKTIEYRL